MLIEGRANRRTKPAFSARSIADGRRDRAELPEHFTLKKRRGVLQAKSLQRALGEISKHFARLVVEIVERRRRFRGRCNATTAVSSRRLPEGGERRRHHDERARRVFLMARDHTPAFEHMEQAN